MFNPKNIGLLLEEDQALVAEILFTDRVQQLTEMDNQMANFQASTESLFATSLALSSMARILSTDGLPTSNTKIPELFSNLSILVGKALVKISNYRDQDQEFDEAEKLVQEDLDNILKLLKNVKVDLPEGL